MEDSTASVDPLGHSTIRESNLLSSPPEKGSTPISNPLETPKMEEGASLLDHSLPFSMDEDIPMTDENENPIILASDPLINASMPSNIPETGKAITSSNPPDPPIKKESTETRNIFPTPPPSQPKAAVEQENISTGPPSSRGSVAEYPILIDIDDDSDYDTLFLPENRSSVLREDSTPPNQQIKLEPTSPPGFVKNASRRIGRVSENSNFFDSGTKNAEKNSPDPTGERVDSPISNAQTYHAEHVGDNSSPVLQQIPQTPQALVQGKIPSQLDHLILELSGSPNRTNNDAEYVHDDSTDTESESELANNAAGTKKRKRAAKPTGPRAKTAREYFKRKNDKISPNMRRGYKFKRAQIAELHKSARQSYIRKAKTPNKRSKTAPTNLNLFLNSSDRGAQYEPIRDDDFSYGEKSNLEATSKEGFFEIFMEQHPDLDLHKCKIDWSDLKKKSRYFGYHRMQKDGDFWVLKNLKTSLYNHQMIGAQWMISRECSPEGPFGGIVADDMGSGKTVQTLAVIIGNPPDPRPGHTVKATIVIVPPGLKIQWWREIKKHAPKLAARSMIYDSRRDDNSIEKLESSELVLTTYSEIVKSLPQPDPQQIKKWRESGLDIPYKTSEWSGKNFKRGGDLHKVKWYRIVIDESHHIKNPDTRLFRAAYHLQGEYRWLLSGTPIMNRYLEFLSAFRFLRDPLCGGMDATKFVAHFCKPTALCTESLSIALSDVIIRRSVDDKVMGLPIVRLPPIQKTVLAVKRYKSERVFYRIIRVHLRQLLNMHLVKGDERNKLASLLPQLTRLRQMIAHPDLIGRSIMDVLKVEGLKEAKKELQGVNLVARSKPISRILLDRIDTWIDAKRRNLYKPEIVNEPSCLICNHPDEDMVMIKKCKHTFCPFCLNKSRRHEIIDDDSEIIAVYKCPFSDCKAKYSPDKEGDIKPVNAPAATSSKTPGIKKSWKGKDFREFRPTLTGDQLWASQWLQDFDKDKDTEMLPTAKLRGTIKQIEIWLEDAPDDKIIVFSQFRFFAILVGILLEQRNIDFIYYTGDMNPKQRDDAISEMESKPSVKVMLAGLKCGGQGLNLQFANRGIITDIWWNNCIDNQALSRFHRMGQKKPSVHFVRIVVTKTVDSKIINLQEDKRKAITKVMQDKLTQEVLEEILEYKEDESDEEEDIEDESEDYVVYEDGF